MSARASRSRCRAHRKRESAALRLAHFFVLDNVFRPRICSHEHENKFAGVCGHGYGTNSRVNLDSWSSNYGLGAPEDESSPRSNSRHGFERVKSDQSVPRGAFDGMEMQSMPVCKAFHEGCFIGNRWQMPSMQKHGVHTCSVRQVKTCDCRSK